MRNPTTLFLYMFLIVFVSSCGKNAVEEYQKGNVEKAYSILLKKAQKKDLEREERTTFSNVIQDLVKKDSINLNRYLNSDRLEDKIAAYDQLKMIDQRYKEIAALQYVLPNYEFYSRDMFDDMSYAVTESLVENAQINLKDCETNGNKRSAQIAYEQINDLNDYHLSASYPTQTLKSDCLKCGTYFTVIQLINNENRDGYIIDRYFNDDDLRFSNSDWNEFHTVPSIGIEYDRIVDIVLDDADWDDDSDRNTQNYTESIIVRYETKVDTAGVTTQDPIYGDVSASFTTEKIERELQIRGYVNVESVDGQNFRRNISSDYKEEINTYSSSGDERALPQSDRNRLNGNREEFSSERDFYKEAIEDFLDDAEREIRRL